MLMKTRVYEIVTPKDLALLFWGRLTESGQLT